MKKIIFPFLLLALTITASAQKGDEGGITPQQKAKLMSIMYELDGKLKPVIAADTKLQSQMQQELKNIAAIKDAKQRNTAIAAYHTKYKPVYSAMMKKAGVDLAKYVKELNTNFPGYQFMLSGDYAIIGKSRSANPQPTQPAGPVTTQIKNFNTSKSIGCGGIGGGSVTFTSNSVKASAFATVAGGCNNSGEITAQFDVPHASAASITISHVLKANAFAVGILGTGITSGICCVFTPSDTRRISVLAMAPVLWASYEEDEKNETITMPVSTNASQTVRYIANVIPMSGLPSEANGDASISGISIRLTTQP